MIDFREELQENAIVGAQNFKRWLEWMRVRRRPLPAPPKPGESRRITGKL